ncbi:MAG: zinc ribbon domain-containing protein [Longimicrobiales bacterium]|nr:zinc ribbon domain-containing protein [Longimicrobiales bacterium]
MLLVTGLIVIGVVAWVVLEPIMRGRAASLERSDDEVSEVEAVRRVRLLALRDTEYDYHMGKLDDADFAALKRELTAEALEAMKAVEEEASTRGGRSSRAEVEAEVAALRRGLRDGSACTRCARMNPSGSRFCASCGTALHLSGSTSA